MLYFQRCALRTVLKSYSYKICHGFRFSFTKLSFLISAFNAHTYFFVTSEKVLYENMQKTLKTTQNFLTTEENQSQAVRKQLFFLCEVVVSKV